MNEILAGLEPAITKLSEIFCVSVDVIREHGMEYILMYGKYAWIGRLLLVIPVVAVAGALISGLVWLLLMGFVTDFFEIDEEKIPKIYIKGVIITWIILQVSAFLIVSAQYWINPEIYSVKAVIELMRGV